MAWWLCCNRAVMLGAEEEEEKLFKLVSHNDLVWHIWQRTLKSWWHMGISWLLLHADHLDYAIHTTDKSDCFEYTKILCYLLCLAVCCMVLCYTAYCKHAQEVVVQHNSVCHCVTPIPRQVHCFVLSPRLLWISVDMRQLWHEKCLMDLYCPFCSNCVVNWKLMGSGGQHTSLTVHCCTHVTNMCPFSPQNPVMLDWDNEADDSDCRCTMRQMILVADIPWGRWFWLHEADDSGCTHTMRQMILIAHVPWDHLGKCPLAAQQSWGLECHQHDCLSAPPQSG